MPRKDTRRDGPSKDSRGRPGGRPRAGRSGKPRTGAVLPKTAPPKTAPPEGAPAAREALSHRTAVTLDAESCEALEITTEESSELVAYVCGVAADLILSTGVVEVLGFGSFEVKLFRPGQPARSGDHSFVEAPYFGPVEFTPGALLLRQLRARAVEPTIVARCDALYTSIRDGGRVQRGKVPVLIKAAFRALTSALIASRLVEVPGIGCLVVRGRPTVVRYHVETAEVETEKAAPELLLRISRSLLDRIAASLVSPRAEAEG